MTIWWSWCWWWWCGCFIRRYNMIFSMCPASNVWNCTWSAGKPNVFHIAETKSSRNDHTRPPSPDIFLYVIPQYICDSPQYKWWEIKDHCDQCVSFDDPPSFDLVEPATIAPPQLISAISSSSTLTTFSNISKTNIRNLTSFAHIRCCDRTIYIYIFKVWYWMRHTKLCAGD